MIGIKFIRNKKTFLKNNLIWFLLSSFIVVNLYFVRKGGVTYDEPGYRFGSKIIIQTLQGIINFDFTLAKSYYSDLEYYGQLLLTPTYLFSHFTSTYLFRDLDMYFINFFSYDDKYYFFSHVFLTIYIAVLLFFIYKLIKQQRNTQFALLFITFLILTPSFNGHSLFNFKDIPFALHFFIVILYIEKYFIKINESKNINKKEIFLFGLIFGALLNIRINSIPFIGLFILFYAPKIFELKKLKEYLILYFQVGLVGLSFLILLTPSMWIEPISWWKLAIENQFLLKWPGSTLVNGEFIVATEMTYSYLLTFFLYKLPINFLILIFVFLSLMFLFKNINDFSKKCLYLIISVNILFIIFKPTAYDGIRQYLFLILPIVYISLESILSIQNKKRIFNFVIVINLIYLLITQISLGPYKYTYFNEFVNEDNISKSCENIDGCGDWATDYWGFSGKEIANYINNNLNEGFLLICRPDISVRSYLDDEKTNFVYNNLKDKIDTRKLNYTTSDTTVLRDLEIKSFYMVTFHRPRLNENSCLIDPNIEPIFKSMKCEDIFINSTNLRNKEINLSYLKYCNL